jgi:predicted O-methyltransferase YrrM
MTLEYRSPDWDTYRMDYSHPHRAIEAPDAEIAEVTAALAAVQRAGMLPHRHYDEGKFLAFRHAVRELFEIPWTAITPRMQRFIYALNAIAQPRQMVAAGIFCGNTFISNAGAAVGPGACYTAECLLGVEIVPEEAERAERNVRKIDATGIARIVTADALDVVAAFDSQIDLLYLDADGAGGRGKGIYLDILETAGDKMPAGSLILAHNSVNCAGGLADYLAYVRDPAHCRASMNIILDGEGLEVSMK